MDFARGVAEGLRERPRRVDCRFLYDERGSELYERITAQPEYYPTRTEAAILDDHAHRLPRLTGPVTLVELGSGSSVKTRTLLDVYGACASPVRYVPVDVSGAALSMAGDTIDEPGCGVQFIGVHGRYEDVFPLLRHTSPCMVMFLGSTIGNFDEQAQEEFFDGLAAHLDEGDFVLLGVDLVKDPAVIEAAYNDAAGVTADFNRNVFARMNRELGADIDVEAIVHEARWNPARRRIEIDALFTKDQRIRVAPLGETYVVDGGERVRVEISRKFSLSDLRPRLETHGFTVRNVLSDPRGWFALLVMQRRRRARTRPSAFASRPELVR
jgi:L-histidine N-alpha-methyltransferase